MLVDAIVLGAGAPLSSATPGTVRCLTKVNGKPMVEWVLDALDEAISVGRVVLLLPPGVERPAWPDKIDAVLDAGDTVSENIQTGIDYFGDDGWVLLVMADIPLLTAEAVDDFTSRCQSVEADAYYSIVSMGDVRDRFPDTKRTTMRLTEGEFTGGNVFLIKKKTFPLLRVNGERAFARRKSPVRLLLMLGLGFVLRLFTGRLSVRELEAKASALLGAKVVAVQTPFVSIGVDVDKDSDLILAEAALAHIDHEAS